MAATRLGLALLSLLVLGCSSVPAPAAPLGELSALETVELFRARLHERELGRAHELLFEPVREKDLRHVARGASELSRGWSDFDPVEAREEGDVAVVVIREHLAQGKPARNYYPVCLARQGGRWRVLPNGYTPRKDELTPDQLSRFGALEGWFEDRKAALPAEADDQ